MPSVTFPEEWAGKKGVIGIVSSAEDGQLYQVCLLLHLISKWQTNVDSVLLPTSSLAWRNHLHNVKMPPG